MPLVTFPSLPSPPGAEPPVPSPWQAQHQVSRVGGVRDWPWPWRGWKHICLPPL